MSLLQDISDKSLWETFPVLKKQGIFLQSFYQKKLYEALGQKTWLLSSGAVRSLVTKVPARRGTFLFLPYGPLVEGSPEENESSLKIFFEGLKALAREEKAAFVRVSPFWQQTFEGMMMLKYLGLRMAPLHLLAETPWMLDLTQKSEDEILQSAEKKHRNLIRRAEKDGVVVKSGTSEEALGRFFRLHEETVERHKFTPYPKDYFSHQVRCFSPGGDIKIYEAFYQGSLLASAIIMTYGKVSAYHHGASSSHPLHRKIPASYLLQWEVIKDAKKEGKTHYNFWGIAPEDNPKHPFYGITHFKTGFGGRRMDLIPAHDLVISPKYYLTYAIETARRWKRGF